MRASAVLLLFVIVMSSFVAAQTTSATLSGRVVDPSNAAITGAAVTLTNLDTNARYDGRTNDEGSYSVGGLPPGSYRVEFKKEGFKTLLKDPVVLHVQDVLALNVSMQIGTAAESITVSGAVALVDTETSTQGEVLDNQLIRDMPVNGRNYLDLMQLVPGVTINRQANQGSDVATPVLGERGGNTGYFIDGLDNTNQLNGGAAAQFNQETIGEFRVETTGYKAEFGHASGGVVNVITRSGTNTWHGVGSAFHRNSVFDSANTSGLVPAPDPAFTKVPPLVRWDYTLAGGGPLVKDKVFVFASAERIHESRRLNFVFPEGTPAPLQEFENSFNNASATRETRVFGKLDEQLGRHHLTEEVNWTNQVIRDFLPLSQATNLPSTRTNSSARRLLLGFSDTILLGQQNDPFLLTVRGQYRGEPSFVGPAHPEAGPATAFFIFSGYETGSLGGDLGSFTYGTMLTASTIDQKYASLGASLAKHWGKHNFKLGWDFLRTKVDGNEANAVRDQLFATLDDFLTFGPIDAGLFTVTTIGGLTPEANLIKLRNNYNGLYLQDDWKPTSKLTLNLGVRWDYDSEFRTKTNVAPRLGFAFALTSKTAIRGSWGLFFDRFRLGLARNIPEFGGADLRLHQPLSIPRLFYGNPSIALSLIGPCADPVRTDAEVQAQGLTCPFGPFPYYGVDHLNKVVAGGHSPIPANVPVNETNIQQLSGLSPQQWLDAASASVGKPSGYFYWGPFGVLSWEGFGPSGSYPVVVDPSFKTPYTSSYTFSVEHQLSPSLMIGADYFHKDIYHILGVRQTNLDFANRIPGNENVGTAVNGYGPWYAGTYNGFGVRFEKRFDHRFSLAGSYNYSHAIDDALCSDFVSSLGGTCFPTDAFIGQTTEVTDPGSGKTNADGPFTASNGNYVPKAGIFWNGPSLDTGPSDFALTHVFQLNGSLQLPLKFEVSSIFRAQSGFHFSRQLLVPVDQDGNSNYNLVDFEAGRNHFIAPAFVNMDMRVAREFRFNERVKLRAMFELFNVFNNANPAAVETIPQQPTPLGKPLQVLPGREGQIGLRLEF